MGKAPKNTLRKNVVMVDLNLLAQAVLSEGKRLLVSAATLRVVASTDRSLLLCAIILMEKK
jgi:hypothetical protein